MVDYATRSNRPATGIPRPERPVKEIMVDHFRGRPRLVVPIATVIACSPLIAALAWLSGRQWYPVLDLAMTEFRLRDVGTSETPLIGLPGRIGELPDQGSHPGPLSFWMLAPLYRVFGSTAWAMEAATVVIHMGWTALALGIVHRRRGAVGVAAVVAVIAVVIRGMGLTVMVQPWNPYLPLIAWLVVILATWAVLDGDHWMLMPLVAAASFAAQTHIPYLTMAGTLGAVAFVIAAWRARRVTPTPDDRNADSRPIVWTAVAFGVLWVGTIVDQVVRDPGNLRRLFDHFSSPSEDAIGFVSGFRLLLRHLDPVTFLRAPIDQGVFLESGFDPDGPIVGGLLVLVLFIGAIVVSWRRPLPDSLRHLHTTLALALVVSWISMSRIFGLRWFYLTLWAWITTTVIFVAIGWTAVALLRQYRPKLPIDPIRQIIAGAVLGSLFIAGNVAAAVWTGHPEEELGETLGELTGPTVQNLTDRGVTGKVLVDFDDSYFFGSQAFGLVNELERAGFHAGMISFWRVPVTASRVVEPSEAAIKVVLVTGGFLDDWRDEPLAFEVAAVDPRDDEGRARFAELREELLVELEETGLDDLVPLVDTNLFGLNVDLRISDRARELSGEMIALGQETAVFVAGPEVVPVTRR